MAANRNGYAVTEGGEKAEEGRENKGRMEKTMTGGAGLKKGLSEAPFFGLGSASIRRGVHFLFRAGDRAEQGTAEGRKKGTV